MPAHVRRLLVVSGGSLVAFFLVVAAWQRLPGVTQLDEAVSSRLNAHAQASSTTVDLFLAVTFLGTSRCLIWMSVGIVAILLVLGHWRFSAAWTVTQLVSIVLIEHVKSAFARSRPPYNGMFTIEDSYSFPSGHALGSIVTFGMIAYLVRIGWSQAAWQRIGIGVCITLIALIGFSRVYLGVHYLSDVVAGYLLGAAWLAFALALIEDIRGHYGRPSAGTGGQ